MSALSYFNEPAPLAWDVAAAIFGASELEGGLWNASALSTVFQLADGSIPSLPGDPVGLVLDTLKEMGPELRGTGYVVNVGGATNPASYDPVTGEGTASRVDTTDASGVRIDDLVTGSNYVIDVECLADAENNTSVRRNSLFGPGYFILLVGERRQYYFQSTSDNIVLSAQNNDNTTKFVIHSVREVSGNHLSQPTASARPTLARMPLTGRRNLLTPSQDFSHSAWNKVDVTLGGIGVDGLSLVTSSGAGARVVGLAAVPNGSTAVFSIDLKKGNTDWIFLNLYAAGAGGVLAWFNLATGEAGSHLEQTTGVFIDSVIEEVRDGVFRCTVVGSHPTGTAYNVQVSPASGDGSTTRPATGATWYQGRAQLNLGDSTPYQHVRSAYDVTEAGVPDTYDLTYDLTDDALTTTFPTTITGDILIAGRNGSIIEPFTGNTLTIGPDTYTGGTPDIMRAIGGIVGVLVIDRSLTQVEKDQLISYYKGKGAKGLLVPGPELVPDLNAWVSYSGGSASVSGSELTVTSSGTHSGIQYDLASSTMLGGVYLVKASITDGIGRATFDDSLSNPATPNTNMTAPSELKAVLICRNELAVVLRFRTAATASTTTWDGISVRELRAEEDWT